MKRLFYTLLSCFVLSGILVNAGLVNSAFGQEKKKKLPDEFIVEGIKLPPGIPDIRSPGSLAKTSSVFPHILPSYTFAPKTLPDPAKNYQFRPGRWIGDVDGDGKTDYAYNQWVGDDRTPADYGDNVDKLIIFYATNVTDIPDEVHYEVWGFPIGDHNNDGFDDMLDINTMTILFGSASGLVPDATPMTNYVEPEAIHQVGDINGDGYEDFINQFRNGGQFVLGNTFDFINIDSFCNFWNWDQYNFRYYGVNLDGDADNEVLVVTSTYNGGPGSNWHVLDYDAGRNNLVQSATGYFGFGDNPAFIRLSDLNGDTYPDLWYHSYNETTDANDIVVRFGISGNPYFENTTVAILTTSTSRLFNIGDFNNDGFGDAIGAKANDDLTFYYGNATVENGFTEEVLILSAPDEWLGFNTSFYKSQYNELYDFNGDSVADIMFNYFVYDANDRMAEAGTAILPGGAVIDIANLYTLTKPFAEEYPFQYGAETAGLGDIDGDGFDDWGISGYNGRFADLFFGGPTIDTTPDVKILLPMRDGGTIYSIEGGDINGDGLSDVIVPLTHGDPMIGKVYIYFGRITWPAELYAANADVVLDNPADMNQFGYSISVIGDHNGDGYNDFVITGLNFWDEANAVYKRRAAVFFGGPTISPIPDLLLSDSDIDYGSYFGYKVSATGDLNADGFDDFALSERAFRNAHGKRGRVLVYFGGPNPDEQYDRDIRNPHDDTQNFGQNIALHRGDYDGDGFFDLAVQANWVAPDYVGRIFIYRGGPYFDLAYDYIIDLYDVGQGFGAFDFIYEFTQAGKYDLVVGTGFQRPTNAYVYQGSIPFEFERDEADYVIEAPNYNIDLGGGYKFGHGDFNNDKKIDLVMSQWYDDNLGPNTGMVYMYESPFAKVPWSVVLKIEWAADDAHLMFGVHPDATDGIDWMLHEVELPPKPVAGAFDARFTGASTGNGVMNDFRLDQPVVMQWDLELMRSESDDVTLIWGNLDYVDGYLYLRDLYDGLIGVNVNMKSVDRFTISNPTINKVKIVYEPFWAMDYPAGWNLASLGTDFTDNSLVNVFPGAISAYGFDNGYVEATALVPGYGYWVNLSAPFTQTATGTTIDNVELVLPAGWSLLGSISAQLPINAIVQDPPGSIVSLYTFDKVYRKVTDYVEQGHGYWIKLANAATLTLNSAEIPKAAVPVTIAGEPEHDFKFPLMIETDVGNTEICLYMVDQSLVRKINEGFELPPRPPDGIFDVRILDDLGKGYCDHAVENRGKIERTIRLAAPDGNDRLVLTWDNKALKAGMFVLSDGLGGKMFPDFDLSKGNRLDISGVPVSMLKISVNGDASVVRKYALEQNYPNPFNPNTTINYHLEEPGKVVLQVYNVLGQQVKMLMNDVQEAGRHTVVWDGTDGHGKAVAGGIYIYRLQVNGRSFSKKMILIK